METLQTPKPFGSILMGLLLLSGCTWGLGAGEEDTPAMHRNFSRTVDVQTGVVQGDLERAQRAGSWLADPENRGGYPSQAMEYQEEMFRHARDIAEASDLSAVAVSAGQLAAACGSCHEALNGGPRFVIGSSAPMGQTQEAHMVRHIWAADRMWEGLVGPSEDAWLAGARALMETGPALAGAFRGSMPAQALEGYLGDLKGFARDAEAAVGQDQRALAYGKVLDTCHRCHASMGALSNGR